VARPFTALSNVDLANTFARKFIPVADGLRDLATRLGMRPYEVRLVHVVWSGDERGEGVPTVKHVAPLLPTPLVADLSSLQEVVQVVGMDEAGQVRVSQISGRYTEDQLMGRDPSGNPPAPNEEFFYEIEYPVPGGGTGELRRFFPSAAPSYYPGRLEWVLVLERQAGQRDRDGSAT